MGKALVHAIRDGAIVVQGREHMADLVQHIVDADHVQEGFLLAGERGVGQVFGGGGRTDGERALAVGVELGERVMDVLLELGRERSVDDPLPDFRAGFGERAHVFRIQGRQALVDPGIQARILQEIAESLCRRGKAPGTRTPAPVSWLIISPSEAFFPPTESTSVIRSCSNGTT